MKAFLAFLLIPVSMAVYMVLSGRGIYQLYPLGNVAVMLFGLFLLGVMVWKAPTWWRWLLGGVGGVMVLMFLWWVLIYSDYPDGDGGVEVGEVVVGKLGEARLVDDAGRELSFAQLAGQRRATLLVFFRGPW